MVNDEFSKVPHDIGRAVFKRKSLLQEGKDFTGVGTVDVALFEENQLVGSSAELGTGGHDFFGGTRFLAAELIAWEGKNLQTFIPILVGQLPELGVLSLGQCSFGGNVDDDQWAAGIFLHANFLAVNQLVRNGIEV